MKKFLSMFFAGALMIVLGVACDKDDPTPRWTPRSPLELDDELFFYREDGQKESFVRYRKDRVIIEAASYDDARALSTQEVLHFDGTALYLDEWVLGTIDSTQVALSDVLALPGAIDATYALEYGDGTIIQYPTDEIFIQLKPGFTTQGVLEKVGLSEYVISIELFNEFHDIYYIKFNLSVGETLRICRKLYETGQCVFVEPNFSWDIFYTN